MLYGGWTWSSFYRSCHEAPRGPTKFAMYNREVPVFIIQSDPESMDMAPVNYEQHQTKCDLVKHGKTQNLPPEKYSKAISNGPRKYQGRKLYNFDLSPWYPARWYQYRIKKRKNKKTKSPIEPKLKNKKREGYTASLYDKE